MNDFDFTDLRTIDATKWSKEIDPLGLLAYQAYKRKKFFLDEDTIEEKKFSPQQSIDFERVQYGAMKKDDYQKKWKLGKYRPKSNPLHGPGGLYKNLVKSAVKEEPEDINEVLTLQQRMKRKILMRRLAPRIARARKIAMRRKSGGKVLLRRAKGLARKMMSKKLLGGRNKADVSMGERSRIEKILAKRKKAIDRIALRLLPKVRKTQALRFAAKNQTASSSNSK